MIYILSFLSALSIFLFIYSFSKDGSNKKMDTRLLDIKYMFSLQYSMVENGFRGFKSIRFILLKYFGFLNFSKKRKKLSSSGLNNYINEFDIFIIKILTLLIYGLGIFYYYIFYKKVTSLESVVTLNMAVYALFAMVFIFLISWDSWLIDFVAETKQKEFYDQFGFFISDFASGILVGDNVLTALKSTSYNLKGELKIHVDTCIANHQTIGKTMALQQLKESVKIDLMEFLVDVIIDYDDDKTGLYDYLDNNLSDFLKHKEYLVKTNLDKKSFILGIASLFGNISILLLLGTAFIIISNALKNEIFHY